MHADALNKYEKQLTMGAQQLNSGVYEFLFAHPELGECRPVCNLFTDENTTKVPGGFCSRY